MLVRDGGFERCAKISYWILLPIVLMVAGFVVSGCINDFENSILCRCFLLLGIISFSITIVFLWVGFDNREWVEYSFDADSKRYESYRGEYREHNWENYGYEEDYTTIPPTLRPIRKSKNE